MCRLAAPTALALVALITLGCGSAAQHAAVATTASATPRPGPDCTDVPGALVHPPPGPARRLPLVIAFHGLGDNARGMQAMTGLDEVADHERFMTAYPTVADGGRWELNRHDGTGQVHAVERLIDQLVARGCADPRRITLTGFSNGGGFAARAGCVLAGRVAAVVAVAGSYRVTDRCPHHGPRSALLEIHGTRDPWLKTVPRLLRDWLPRNGCTRPPHVRARRTGATTTRWPGCGVARVVLRGTGHTWPSGFAYGVDPTGFDASAALWAFARRHHR